MKQEVTILLPTYNGESYIEEQIDSILKQTYTHIRLILSDDGSTDHTREILQQYEQKHTKVQVYFQEKNLGVVKNIEFLLKKVETPLFMLADQDDVWLPQKIEKSVEALEKEQAILVFGDLKVVDQNLKEIYSSFGDFMLLNRKIKQLINHPELNYLYNCVTGCTILAKKELIDFILPIPTNSKRLIHDHWIGLMASFKGKMAYLSEKYILYRQHGNNQVGTDKISHGFQKLDQVRELFIDVKLGIFGTYVTQQEKFPVEFQKLNEKAYFYFKMVQKKKNFNFKNWQIYHQLYKNETISYYMMNFVIMNLPFLGRGIFRVRYAILKWLKKR